jgi:phage-related protein
MIYYFKDKEEYKIKFYQDVKTGRSPILIYINGLRDKEEAKILKYIEFLRVNKGYLSEPYSKHIKNKIRELRIDFSNNKHRIFYFIFTRKIIILLHIFSKKTKKTPLSEIKKAEENHKNVLKNQKIYF